MGSKCKTCGLTERSHHPCNEAGTLYPCPDEFHREMSIVQCQQPGCTANGLTRARGWWCAIHHPEHPMGPVTPTPPAPADDKCWKCGGGVERTNTTLPGCDNDIFHDGQPPALPTEGAHPNGPVEGCPCHLCRYAFGEDSPADDASGAEAMRERAAKVAETHYLQPCPTLCGQSIAAAIRALPLPANDAVEEAAKENETLRRFLWRAVEILKDEGFTVFPDEVRTALAALRRAKGGGEAPTPADPKNPAPAATSGAAHTTPKDP